jgi:hypothetical protein
VVQEFTDDLPWVAMIAVNREVHPSHRRGVDTAG